MKQTLFSFSLSLFSSKQRRQDHPPRARHQPRPRLVGCQQEQVARRVLVDDAQPLRERRRRRGRRRRRSSGGVSARSHRGGGHRSGRRGLRRRGPGVRRLPQRLGRGEAGQIEDAELPRGRGALGDADAEDVAAAASAAVAVVGADGGPLERRRRGRRRHEYGDRRRGPPLRRRPRGERGERRQPSC